MARTCRLPDSIILLRAEELRQAGSYKGQCIHHGRGRPAKGQIGFVEALARRTGYSRTIVMRVLGSRTRAGPRASLSLRMRSEMAHLPKSDLATVIQELYQIAAQQLERQGSTDPLLDERLEPTQRLERLVLVLAQGGGVTEPMQRVEKTGGYWATAHEPTKPPPPLAALPAHTLAREALLDALTGALTTEGALWDDDTKRVVLMLRQRLDAISA